MEYTNLILFGLGMLGMFTQLLVKIKGIKQRNKGLFDPKDFLSMEWPNIGISLIVVFVAVIAKAEIKQLNIAGVFLGLGFFAIGYMAQSILMAFVSKYEKKLNDESK